MTEAASEGKVVQVCVVMGQTMDATECLIFILGDWGSRGRHDPTSHLTDHSDYCTEKRMMVGARRKQEDQVGGDCYSK